MKSLNERIEMLEKRVEKLLKANKTRIAGSVIRVKRISTKQAARLQEMGCVIIIK